MVHIADMPIQTVLALDLVGAHRAGKLRLDTALITLVLDESTSSRVASSTTFSSRNIHKYQNKQIIFGNIAIRGHTYGLSCIRVAEAELLDGLDGRRLLPV